MGGSNAPQEGMMNRKTTVLLAMIALATSLCACLATIGLASAEELQPPPRYNYVYVPLVQKYPIHPRPDSINVKVYNAMGQEVKSGDVVWNEIHVRVDAPGCSSVYPGFVGIDREVYPPTYYHLECTQPDFGPYSNMTTGADVIIYLSGPMWWSDFAVTVYYPNGFLTTTMVKGPWWWLP